MKNSLCTQLNSSISIFHYIDFKSRNLSGKSVASEFQHLLWTMFINYAKSNNTQKSDFPTYVHVCTPTAFQSQFVLVSIKRQYIILSILKKSIGKNIVRIRFYGILSTSGFPDLFSVAKQLEGKKLIPGSNIFVSFVCYNFHQSTNRRGCDPWSASIIIQKQKPARSFCEAIYRLPPNQRGIYAIL